MKNPLAVGALAAALTLGVGTANAYVSYFGEDINGSAGTPLTSLPNSSAAQTAFLSRLTGIGVENFETSQGTVFTFPGANGSSLTATLSGGDGTFATNQPGKTDGFGRYSVPGGTRYWLANAFAGSFTLTFNTPIAAFGFYGVDIGDFGGALQIGVSTAGGQQTITVPHTIGDNGSTDGSVLFHGMVASGQNELFTSLTFSLTGPVGMDNDYFAFDSFTIAQAAQVDVVDPETPIPEPGSLALAALALAGLGFAGRRRGG